MGNLESIRAMVVKYCSPSRQALLEPVLVKLQEYQKTPASTAKFRHGSEEGGLLDHISLVCELGLKFGQSINEVRAAMVEAGSQISPEILSGESIVTAGIIHDLNKTEDVSGNPYYVQNFLKDGKQSEKVPWKVTESQKLPTDVAAICLMDAHLKLVLEHTSLQYPSGLVSLSIAEKWSPGMHLNLTSEEKQAIIWHGGLYEKGNKKGFTGSESLLWIVTHAADFSSAIIGR